MPSFETLDLIADLYVPILALLALASLLKTAFMSRWRMLGTHAAMVLLGLLTAYGLMFVDIHLQLWPILELDYSTHTAVAVVMVIFLIIAVKKYSLIWTGSFGGYILLMLYQGYHSIADVLTTAVAVALLVLPAVFLFYKNTRASVYK